MDDFREFIEDIKEISKSNVIISGITDIKDGKMLNTDYWIMVGWAEKDKDMLKWVKLFNPYDLYSKNPHPPKWNEIKEYYQNLVQKYLPDKIKF